MATKRTQTKPDALDAARIKAMATGGTINPNLISAAANGQPSPYIQDPTVSSSFGGTWNMNPDQFATQGTADSEAQATGGSVSDMAPTNGPITYGQPQYGVTAPGQQAPMNAGLVNGLANNSLYDPQQVASFLDNSDGNYTSAENVPPVVSMTNNGGQGINIGSGPVTPAMAAAMRAARGANLDTSSAPAGLPPSDPATMGSYTQSGPGYQPANPWDPSPASQQSSSVPPSTGPIGSISQSGPGATDGGNPGASAQTNGSGSGRTSLQMASGNGRPAAQGSSASGTQMSGITSTDPNSNAAAAAAAAARRTASYPTFPPSSSSPNVPGGPNLPSTNPNGTPNLAGMNPQQLKAMYGDNAYPYALKAWQDSGQKGPAPNQSDYYGSATPAGTGGGAGAGGGGTPSGGYTGNSSGIPTSYVPPMPNGGYPSVPGGYPSPAISAPGSGGDSNLAQSLESDRELAIAGGNQLQTQFGNENAAAAARTAALQGQLGSVYDPLLKGQGGYTADQAAGIMDENGPHGLNTLDPNAMTKAFSTGAAGVNGAVGGEASSVDQSLQRGAANVNSTINPGDLTYTPAMEQAAKEAAARTSAAQTQSTVQDIQNRAFAEGNDSPAAIAAMQDRARQTGAINSSEAMAAAQNAANQAKLAAAQTRTNIESQNQQEIAQRDVGAKLNVGATNVGAQTALTGMGTSAAQAGQTEGMNLNNLESTRSNTIANENQKQSAEARTNLQSQEQQSNQKVDVTGQQQLATLGTQNTGTNQAAGEQIQNKAVNQSNPGNATHIIFGEKGIPPMDGPVVAEVGEKKDPHSPSGYAPEAIVNLGPPHEMAAGGAVRPAKLLAPPRFVMNRPAYGIPAAQPRQISRVGFNRQLPQFEYGGIIKAEDGLISGPPQGGDDPLTLDGPSWWQKAAALGTQAALGRRFPQIAALLAREEMGQGGSGKDLGSAAVGDMLKRNPAAAAAAQQAIGKSPAQQAQDAKWGQDYNDIMNWKPPEYQPHPLAIDSGGGQPSAPSPAPGASTKAPPRKFTPPPAKATPPPTVLDAPPVIPTKPTYDPFPKSTPKIPPPIDMGLHVGNSGPDIPFPKRATPVPSQIGPTPGPRDPFYDLPISNTGPDPGRFAPDPNGYTSDTKFGSGAADPTLTNSAGESTDPYTGIPINQGNQGPDPTQTGSWTPDPNSGEPTYSGQPSFDPTRGGLGTGTPDGSFSDGNVPPWGYTGNPNLDPNYGGYYGSGDSGGGSWAPDPFGGGMDGLAKGGIVSPPSSPYGVEVVDRPQIRVLGQSQAQAVIPLKKNSPGAKVRPGQVPALIQKYARSRPQYGA